MTLAEFMERMRSDLDAFEEAVSDEETSLDNWFEQFQFFSEGRDDA